MQNNNYYFWFHLNTYTGIKVLIMNMIIIGATCIWELMMLLEIMTILQPAFNFPKKLVSRYFQFSASTMLFCLGFFCRTSFYQ